MNISISRSKDRKGKPGFPVTNIQMRKDRSHKPHRVEPLVKEEGEMSGNEEVYEQFREVKWMEWCEDVMKTEIKTLNRLHKLQTTSANLPKDLVHLISCLPFLLAIVFILLQNYVFIGCIFLQVLSKIRKYLQLLGRRIDQIVLEHDKEQYKQDSKLLFILIELFVHPYF